VLERVLARLLAVRLLVVGHVVLQDGVAGLALRHARDGVDGHLAVKHAQVLAPGAGRLLLGGEVRLPVAHDSCGDTALQRRRATSYYFLFRKEMLPCEHVEWRKRRMSGSRCLCVVGGGIGRVVGSGRRLDASWSSTD